MIWELILKLLSFIKFVATNNLPKPLSKEEEEQYLDLYKNHGDENARKILIERNLRLVANIVKKYDNRRRDVEDLISIGTIGLIKGVASYNPKKESKLSTYISKCIENEILMSIRTSKKENKEVSLFEQVGTDKEGNELFLMDIIYSDERELFDKINLKMNTEKLYKNISTVLTDMERSVVVSRYGLFNNKTKTQNEVASDLNISRSYVSRIEKRALEKLKESLVK